MGVGLNVVVCLFSYNIYVYLLCSNCYQVDDGHWKEQLCEESLVSWERSPLFAAFLPFFSIIRAENSWLVGLHVVSRLISVYTKTDAPEVQRLVVFSAAHA